MQVEVAAGAATDEQHDQGVGPSQTQDLSSTTTSGCLYVAALFVGLALLALLVAEVVTIDLEVKNMFKRVGFKPQSHGVEVVIDASIAALLYFACRVQRLTLLCSSVDSAVYRDTYRKRA